MTHRLVKLVGHTFKALSYSAIGASVVLIIGFIVYMNGRADLQVWHLTKLDEEFTANSARPMCM